MSAGRGQDVCLSGQRVPGSCGPGIPFQGQQGAGLTCRPGCDMDAVATSLPHPTLSPCPTQPGSGPSTGILQPGPAVFPKPPPPQDSFGAGGLCRGHRAALDCALGRPAPRGCPTSTQTKRAQSCGGQSSLRTVTGLRTAPGQTGGSARAEGHPKMPGQSPGHTEGTWWASPPQSRGRARGRRTHVLPPCRFQMCCLFAILMTINKCFHYGKES